MAPRAKALVARLQRLRRRAFRFNYYRCHLTYFIFAILVSSAAFYGANPNAPSANRVSYTDSLFLAASAMTTTGLNTVNLNVLNAYQQSVLFVLMICGDLSTVSVSVVVIRRIMFRRRIAQRVEDNKAAAREMVHDIDEELAIQSSRNGRSSQDGRHESVASSLLPDTGRARAVIEAAKDRLKESRYRYLGGLVAPWELPWAGSLRNAWSLRKRSRPSKTPTYQYLSFKPSFDGRGRFQDLSRAEYEELGGVEYRALRLLGWILPAYTCFWMLLGITILTPYAAKYQPVADVIRNSQPGNLNPSWWAVFTAVSSYTNTGLDQLNASMIPFRGKYLVLFVSGTAIVAGNTFYPIFLRGFVWTLRCFSPAHSEVRRSLDFLMHHPRRCYLWLFDAKTTWILIGTQLALICGEWALFEILNIRQTAIWAIPTGTRVMAGLYSSLGTRSSGYYIVSISDLAPALQIIYMIVMYFSVFPVLISLRTTNVYEERSLGLQADIYRHNSPNQEPRPRQPPSPGYHIRHQLAYDLWWMMLSWILICVIEEPLLNDNAPGFNEFSILFEVVSAYGNCGLTLGVPDDTYALCGDFHALSKLILITVMLRGRHRILPVAIDRSILLPGEGTMEEVDGEYNPRLHGDDRNTER